MNFEKQALTIVEEHMIIRGTIGYEAISKVDICDLPEVLSFLQVVWNYNKMNNILKELNDTN